MKFLPIILAAATAVYARPQNEAATTAAPATEAATTVAAATVAATTTSSANALTYGCLVTMGYIALN